MRYPSRVVINRILLASLLLLAGGLFLAPSLHPAAAAPIPTPDGQLAQLERAVREAVRAQDERIPVYVLYEIVIDRVQISADGQWGAARLTPVEPESGRSVATEHGLALARWQDRTWRVSLPGQGDWPALLLQMPDELVSPAARELLYQQYRTQSAIEAPNAPVSGFLLPWQGGKTLHLSRSILHYNPPDPAKDMHYSFDFALASGNAPSSVMFELYAAKSGRVHLWRDHIPNGTEGTENANYLVIEDLSTTPATYHLYMHLAQNSIPAQLKVKGTPVQRGQFIGIADDTGYSTDHHLHFQVHTNPSSYWGKAIDIIFGDVAINGGRPRTVYEAANYPQYGSQGQTYYTSQNYPVNVERMSPVGDILAPAHGSTLSANPLSLEGWATDVGGSSSEARFQARFGSSWLPVSNWFTATLFSASWDVCAAGVPDGPLSLALEIHDSVGNQASGLPGLRHLSKSLDCPPAPPACTPGSSEVALFAEPNYQGSCVVLGQGKHAPAALGALGDNNAASIQVGSNAQATLFLLSDWSARGTTFFASNANLADDPIGNDTLSSLWVQDRNLLPAAPAALWPANGANLNPPRSITLSWDNPYGATQYQVSVIISPTLTITSTWASAPYFALGSLGAGNYSWKVRGSNPYGVGSWSGTKSFTILAGSPGTPLQVAAPYTATMEDLAPGWVSSGEWDLTDDYNHSPAAGAYISYKYDVTGGNNYDSGGPNGGSLTSPQISLPAGQTYYLRFWYRYETEGSGPHWDQRWLQLSLDGGPFTNLLQLSSDRANNWRLSPPISLAAYAGHAIQLRFDFATLDRHLNGFRGWYVDDIGITTDAPPNCGDSNNGVGSAQAIAYGDVLEASICPNGDVDFYHFSGVQGQHIGAAVDASVIDSQLDPVLQLLAADGTTVLVENDDRIPGTLTDSYLTFVLPVTGEYYLRVQDWDHPNVGGTTYPYQIRLANDSGKPTGHFTAPLEGGRIPAGKVHLALDASDAGSGVSHVVFFYHNPDWQNGSWLEIGQDWDGSDGWGLEIDGANLVAASGHAFYARVIDWAGNEQGTGVWNISNRFFNFIPMSSK